MCNGARTIIGTRTYGRSADVMRNAYIKYKYIYVGCRSLTRYIGGIRQQRACIVYLGIITHIFIYISII